MLFYSLLVIILGYVQAKSSVKSSLVFVIDDTYSMSDDIRQVKENTNLVFNTVLNSNESQIDNFILVTFNDPASMNKVLTTTRDRATFRRALSSISVHGGGDCPEYSISGIELALKVSHPHSYIYVFTDATAKDYDEKLDKVQNTAMTMNSQIVFLLTGHCNRAETAPDYAAYFKLAKATDGNVFHMKKSNVGEVLKYISDTIESRKPVITEKKLPPGHHEVKYPVDDTMKDTTIRLSGHEGDDVKVAVYDPSGVKAKTKSIMDLPNNKVIKLTDPETGNYTAKVDSRDGSTLTVTAKTSFNFRHGFSVLKPSSLNATSTRPIAGVNSNILIKFDTPDEHIKLKSIQIVDLDYFVIMDLGVEVLDETEKTYVASGFVPPDYQFKIAIIAHNHRTGEDIRRSSKTIESQKPELVEASPKSPTAEILEGNQVIKMYKEAVKLTCRVYGYPKPTIVWEHLESGSKMTSTFSVVEAPYDYVSTLDIPSVESNDTYRCKASTNGKEVGKDVKVILKNKFTIVEVPKEIYRVPYNEEVHIPCKVIAYPPAKVTWYFNEKILSGDEDITVSDDEIIIKHMQLGMEGRYSCNIQNEFDRNVTNFNIEIIGTERPVISKSIIRVTILRGSDATITCRLLAGNPTPVISWKYFPKDSDGYVDIKHKDATVNVKNVREDQAGTFMCEARNVVGIDHHYIKLNVESPPEIKRDAKSVNARAGTSATLHCFTKGNPKPHVIWTLNDKIVVSDREHHIYRDHSLRIRSSLENTGNYTCVARNKHGVDIKTVDVRFVVPVSIEIPEKSTIDTQVGRGIMLACHATGYPEPTIEWIFRSTDPTAAPKVLKADNSGSLSLKQLKLSDDGFYTCNASNIEGASNITYQVNVNGPPVIENVENTIYRAVEGDLVVRMPCKATGKPKPVVTWSLNSLKVAKDTEWYDIDEDGTLLIKNVDIKSRGYYLCKATNYLGSDQKYYLLDVNRSPYEEAPTSVVALNQTQTAVVNCSLPQNIGSKLKWFKDDRLITEGQLVIDNAKAEDSGIYICRVSTFAGSKSASVDVIVTSAPEFESDPETTIEFEERSYTELDCMNYAEPAAKTEWFFNNKRVDTDSSTHYFQMLYTSIGNYTCVVSNEIGSINRTFVIKTRDCALHMQNDFTGNLPIMVIPYDFTVKTVGDYLYIPKNLVIDLSCSRSFTKIPRSKILARCNQDSKFLVDGVVHEFSDLKCDTKISPEILSRGFRCGAAYTEIVDVGFTAEGKFSPVYEVCVDKRNYVPIYSKIILRRVLSDISPKDPEWFDSTYTPFDFSAMYDCKRQNLETSRTLNKWFHGHDTCCFGKRQLVSPKDVFAGLSQAATYSNLNVVPQWSTCNVENWDNLEERIRSLAKSTDKNLLLWTGQADRLSLRDSSDHDVNVTLTDGIKQQPIPKYLWKVIQDPSSRSSLAIIQVNIPDLTPEEARYHVLCPDICHTIPWMNDDTWRDVTRGYTYCCRIRDFENAFGFRNKFSRGGDSVLTHVSYISTSSLV